MLFNSFVFWIFFGLVFVLYRRLPHRGQNRLLLVASYVFYGYWDYRFLSLLALSTVVDFAVGRGLAEATEQRTRKLLVSISIAVNLGILGFFKYFDFFVTEAASLLASIGFSVSPPVLNIILPVGISFYTFQTMSYTIDVYRGRTEPARNILDFALYVSFFPQLVAGPIERSSSLLPQIISVRRLQATDFSEGFYLVLMGLFKKIVIADNMAPIVNRVFATPAEQLTGVDILVGVYAFAFQIYGDFSGYSSIAKGIARWMGFELMWNFRHPYFALNPSDFWGRWHISLSSWLRDYLYIPLGGNRFGPSRTFFNLMTTMVLGGFWHGAGWPFMFWGVYHGFLLIVYRIVALSKIIQSSLKRVPSFFGKPLALLLFFHLICFSWLLFRAESMVQVVDFTHLLFTDLSATAFSAYALSLLLFFCAPMILFEVWVERKGDMLAILSAHPVLQAGVHLYLATMLILFPPLSRQIFIYFQF